MKQIGNLLRMVLNAMGYKSDAQIQSALAKVFEATGTDPNEFATQAVQKYNELDTTGAGALEKADKDTDQLRRYYTTRLQTIKGQRDAGEEILQEAARIQNALEKLGISLTPLADDSLLD
jgi:hypothetical protein